MNKKIALLITILLIFFIVFYIVFVKNEKNTNGNIFSIKNEKKDDALFSNKDEVIVNLSNYTDAYKISEGGIYHFIGTYNSYIEINTEEDVKIILDNVTINNLNGPCIYGVNSNNLYIEITGENSLTDGSSYVNIGDEITSVIFSNDDIILSGTGVLNITANNNGGISGDDIIINGGTINIIGQSPFVYNGEAKYNGGIIIVNGQTINELVL